MRDCNKIIKVCPRSCVNELGMSKRHRTSESKFFVLIIFTFLLSEPRTRGITVSPWLQFSLPEESNSELFTVVLKGRTIAWVLDGESVRSTTTCSMRDCNKIMKVCLRSCVNVGMSKRHRMSESKLFVLTIFTFLLDERISPWLQFLLPEESNLIAFLDMTC